MTALDTTPIGTQVNILRAVLSEKYPKFALGDIASRFGITYADLRVLIDRHGYPDPVRMSAAATALEARAATDTAAAENAIAHAEPEVDHQDDDEHHGDVMVRVPISRIHPDPENVRQTLTDIEELADSIVEVGLLQPIVVRRDGKRLIVVAGHRRLAALKHLKHTDALVVIRAPMTPDHVLAAMLIENGQRADLDPIDEARGLAALKRELDCSDADLAKRVGRSGTHVSIRLALLNLTPSEQADLRAGNLGVIQGAQRGRLNAGKVMAPGQLRDWHLGQLHDLAGQVKARCIRMKHKGGRKVGGMGCGECWESVIRTDERTKLLGHFHDTDTCPTCGQAAPTKPVNV